MCSLHTFPFLLCLPFELSSKCPSAYGRFFATLSADCLCRHLQIHRGNSKYENMTTLEDWTVLPKLTSESSVWQTNCLPWWLLPLVVNETHKHRCRIISVMISPSFSACRSSPPSPVPAGCMSSSGVKSYYTHDFVRIPFLYRGLKLCYEIMFTCVSSLLFSVLSKDDLVSPHRKEDLYVS